MRPPRVLELSEHARAVGRARREAQRRVARAGRRVQRGEREPLAVLAARRRAVLIARLVALGELARDDDGRAAETAPGPFQVELRDAVQSEPAVGVPDRGERGSAKAAPRALSERAPMRSAPSLYATATCSKQRRS